MKRLLITMFFSFIMISVKCQDFTQDMKIIDKDVAEYIEKGLYLNASDLLLNFALVLEENGDTTSAFSYHLKNCELMDNNYNTLLKQGLTNEEYFNNFLVAICVGDAVGEKEQSLSLLFHVLNRMVELDPQFLVVYNTLISSFLISCQNPKYYDSIGYYLQETLNVIITSQPSKTLVKTYVDVNKCLLTNRFYNAFVDNQLNSNKLPEILEWYNKNNAYIKGLDPVEFESDIVDFFLLFTDELSLYASTFSGQNKDIENSLLAYKLELSILDTIPIQNGIIHKKKALCYSNIATQYGLLLDYVASKEYADKALEELRSLNYDDLDYCYILNNLSFVYSHSNQNTKAANLKLEEISVKEKMGVEVSLSDWNAYFTFVNAFDPQIIIDYDKSSLPLKKASCESLIDYYNEMGTAYTRLLNNHKEYRNFALQSYEMMDSVIEAYHDYLVKKEWIGPYNVNEYSVYKSSYYLSLGNFFANTCQLEQSLDCYSKALALFDRETYSDYSAISSIAAYLHDKKGIKTYIQKLYKLTEYDLLKMLPIYGTVESDVYLLYGNHQIYRFSEYASWNPSESVCVSTAYDAALLMKGLTLRYNVLTPYYESHPELIGAKRELDRMRDSIYAIPDDNSRVLALHRYELKEREILKEVNDEFANLHWGDVANQLNDDEACVEFVKYTADGYSWSDNVPRPHYAALVLQHKAPAPVFVDLFDEEELTDMYNLQPKSYDNEIGLTLYSKIWGKLEQYIDGNNKVFFSPMGLLNLINVELLTDSTGMTAAERFNLYRVSSTRNLLTRDDNRDFHSVAMFGGVDYEKAQEYNEMLVSMNTRGNWAYLQNTLLEVEQIEDLLKGSSVDVATHTGSFATEGAFKQLDGTQANVVHIATHGYYIPQTQRTSVPYFSNSESTANIQDELFYSGLILSGGQKAWTGSTFKPDNNDGILTAYEISKLDLHNVNLVVLSACETGLGDNLFDGIFGLQRAFKKAGVSSILMSLWKIDDRATSEYMSLFYEKLVGGCSIHDAYIGTVLAMKKKYPDANYWASFVLLD